MDFTRAHKLTPEIEAEIDHAFDYHPWTDDQITAGFAIRKAQPVSESNDTPQQLACSAGSD